jgi:hypothetical protein
MGRFISQVNEMISDGQNSVAGVVSSVQLKSPSSSFSIFHNIVKYICLRRSITKVRLGPREKVTFSTKFILYK